MNDIDAKTASEKEICLLFYMRWYERYEMVVPNVYFEYWSEIDLLGLRPSGYMDEIEIKRTTADFKKDFVKEVDLDLGLPLRWPDRYVKRNKHSEIEAGRGQANRFSFLVFEAMVDKIEVPAYAGLYVLMGEGYIKEVKKAPLLHREKITIEKKYYVARKMCFRYWEKQREIHYK